MLVNFSRLAPEEVRRRLWENGRGCRGEKKGHPGSFHMIWGTWEVLGGLHHRPHCPQGARGGFVWQKSLKTLKRALSHSARVQNCVKPSEKWQEVRYTSLKSVHQRSQLCRSA